MRRVTVFCGSSIGASPVYAEAARAMAVELVARNVEVVYGGGNVGLMGILADSVLSAGGRVVGIIPQALAAREVAHGRLTQLHIVETMHERKMMMADLADAFIALPGGFGTFEEFFEVITWTQLGVHAKPCGLLNADHFYDPLLAFIDHATEERFIRPEHRRMVLHDTIPASLLDRMTAFDPPAVPKWVTLDEV